MARKELTKPERQVAAIVEQTLHALIETDLTVADIMDAAAESARRRSNATTLRWPQKTTCATTRFTLAA
ncbi:MAG: hypothetical protein ACXV2F_04190 [Halobacteriota archaeon]